MKIDLICGDALVELKKMPDESVDCCITSPPYWGLRNYGVNGQFGLEKTAKEYIAKMVEVFKEIKRVLKKEGTLWLNLGDSYNGGGRGGIGCKNASLKEFTNTGTLTMPKVNMASDLKPKDLVGIPWRVAFSLQSDGWYLRQDIIWAKPNPMPESVTDRCTKAHEYIFLFAKSQKYYFDREAIKEKSVTNENRPDGIIRDREYNYNSKLQQMRKGKSWHNHKNDLIAGQSQKKDLPNLALSYRNRRSVWTINSHPFKGAHFATFPEDLVLPCILAGCPRGGVVFDPFSGAGTVGVVCKKNNRNFIGIELNPAYIEMARQRINNTQESMF